ncbi:hypothetical protein [Paracoccus laeviglucosivorans]|uniref:Uncharacterized protein n=1 Tax=Paracoccus laeviglucosivorans TaxID=1197861 RepID=A0A521CMT9_9RHOB|nr:hypothetical protein [Paracoccus laeviglucosivorans]SMO60746.1 hypothetical protein SAMN06265221_10540 [Paracoccus laeviglucosivorans]
MIVLFALGFLMMLAGPFMQGMTGSDNPNAYVFAPVMLAGSIPLLAGRGLSPSPRLMAQAILICGALCMGAWWLGGQLDPVTMPAAAPVGTAITGALVAAAANLLRARKA